MVDVNKPEDIPSFDRRAATTYDITRLIDTIQAMVGTIHQHGADIRVLTARMDARDEQSRDFRTLIEKVAHNLEAHTEQEDKDRKALIKLVVGSIITGVIAIATTVFTTYLVEKL